jgi:hypothetical protein
MGRLLRAFAHLVQRRIRLSAVYPKIKIAHHGLAKLFSISRRDQDAIQPIETAAVAIGG